MGEAEYVKEIKHGAVGFKLPTLIDLNPKTENSVTNRVETPTSRNYVSRDEETGAVKPNKQKDARELAGEIYRKIGDLHAKGRKLDEIYDLLEKEGYEYAAIEPVFIDYLEKCRGSLGQQGQQQQRPPAASPAPGTAGMVAPRPQGNPSFQGEHELELVEIHANPPEMPKAEEMPRGDRRMESVGQPGAEQSPPAEEDGIGRSTGDFAPLFVKVGKYRETLEHLNDLENYLKGMTRLLELVSELEQVRVMNISAIEKLQKKAIATSSKLSSGLLKPRGMQLEGTRDSEVELTKLGDVISDLSKELTILKKEVDKLGQV
ncbi:MAG: hypothetical protein JW727_04530 [Candidatus Aenigmarchaeota archaeon]|nr:hypothetical protein [Candidatus Aenigmarchaeota archaeon]